MTLTIHQVRATADKSWAAAQNSLQAKYDMKKGEASATWTSLVKIHYDGVDYDAGMVIGAELKNGKVSTQIGFSAKTFIVYNPANGKMEPVFAIKNGQVIFNDALISKATIENIIVGMDLKSKNYIPGQQGTCIDMVNGNFEVNGVSSTYRTRLTNKGFYVYSGNTPIIELGEFI
ncbi:DUF1983 domain-containing protein [Arsenophonus sp. ENCA]|uniref:phage tail tip fiber protein n=1 Tax=Arsenophonus sp. ENCA TaxID=1987579 RepID=UPI0025C5336B|nr:DUF1983 domain-containing protein [Arsenophonus sp. ENCA]